MRTPAAVILERHNDGSDWSLGTPSGMQHVSGVHDAQIDFDGNIWFTYGFPSRTTTIARIDGKTGAVKHFKLDDQRGIAIGTHGITRDENGDDLVQHPLATCSAASAASARSIPRTRRSPSICRRTRPPGTAGTIDADLNGNIWVTSPDGALRFDIKEEKFTEFKSVTYKNDTAPRRSTASPPIGSATAGGC